VRKVAIVGIGLTKVGRHFDKGLRELFYEAAVRAIEDAGCPEIEAIIVGNMCSSSLCDQDSLGALLADYCGLCGRAAFKVEAACGSGGVALLTGYMAVASGLYDYVLVGGVEKLTEATTREVTYALAKAADADYELFYGTSFTALNALIMRYYMRKYNVTREDMALWPVKMHENAMKCPHAQFHKRITVDDVLKSPLIADPIRVLDCAPISDGAAAVVLCPLEEARRVSDAVVEVAGIACSTDYMYLAQRPDIASFTATVKAAERAYRMAKVEPRDVDVAEVHDAFSVLGFIDIEDLGFSRRGEAVKLLKEGVFDPGGKPSVNPSGGLKARGHPVGATGVYQVAEVALQLMEKAGSMQVPSPEIGLVQSIGGVGTTVTVAILRRVK